MRQILLLVAVTTLIFCCNNKTASKENSSENFNKLAEKYVRLGLYIGQYDEVFIDAYYGPDSLKPLSKKDTLFAKDSLLKEVANLLSEVKKYTNSSITDDAVRARANWMSKQLVAFSRRIKWFSGEEGSFDTEAKELFDIVPPTYAELHYQSLVNILDSLLPGAGTIQERVQVLSKKFIIPKNKVDTVFKAAYMEARKRTREHFDLPANENFSFEYVTNKSWSGYNWYKGNYQSLIQQNLDLPIPIERAIDLACHEGYPGHHVYNMLLEKNLYRAKGWVEISLYPLYSPQSFIAEGSANYGIELAFPGEEKIRFTKQVLCPLAAIDTLNVDLYFKMLDLKKELNYARNEAARGVVNKTMTEEQAIQWMMKYMLVPKEVAVKYISFIRANHSYVMNYNYGQDLVKNYIEANGGKNNIAKRWKLFGWLLSNAVTPQELFSKKSKEQL